MLNHYTASTTLPADLETAFAYHERPGALDRLIPPWKNVRVESSDQSLTSGSRVILRLRVGPLSLRWVAVHRDYEPPRLFSDTQESGPFAHWFHEHRFESADPDAPRCVLHDRVEYRLPLAALGQWLGGWAARKELETMFAFRHRITRDDLALAEHSPTEPMTVAISGASGLVGRRLISLLNLLGHRVVRLERSIDKALPDGSAIAPWANETEAAKLNGVDAVVHLAGKSIADARWNPVIKKQIRASRVDLTGQLSQLLAKLENKPRVFVCASAIGIYGNRDDETLTESSPEGDDFLADVAIEWEQACRAAKDAGIRVANARLGIVLDPTAGALKKMLLPAKFLGGKVGSGQAVVELGCGRRCNRCDLSRDLSATRLPDPLTSPRRILSPAVSLRLSSAVSWGVPLCSPHPRSRSEWPSVKWPTLCSCRALACCQRSWRRLGIDFDSPNWSRSCDTAWAAIGWSRWNEFPLGLSDEPRCDVVPRRFDLDGASRPLQLVRPDR